MPGSTFKILPDNRQENTIRRSLLINWVVFVTALAWIAWSISFNREEQPLSIWVPIITTLLGLPAGWFFGYRLGYDALFSGFYVFSKINPNREKI